MFDLSHKAEQTPSEQTGTHTDGEIERSLAEQDFGGGALLLH